MEESTLWLQIVQQFKKSCSDFDGLWIKRRRRFDTESIVRSLLRLAGGHQPSYQSVLDHFPTPPAASSFCEARRKLPSYIIGESRRDLLDVWDSNRKLETWHGYKTHAVDGSKLSLPRELFEYGFKAPACGHCPQALLSTLVRIDDRMICDIRLSKLQNERDEAHAHLEHLSSGDLVVYDRGYLSFSLLTAHIHRSIGAVFRVQQGVTFLAIQKFWRSSADEKIVTIEPSSPTYRSSREQFPEYEGSPRQLRLIKYKIDGKTYVLATTVMDREIPAQDFIDLYGRRWAATEETFKAFKQTLELEIFHSKSENGISQEIESAALLWNLAKKSALLVDRVLKKTPALPNIIALSA